MRQFYTKKPQLREAIGAFCFFNELILQRPNLYKFFGLTSRRFLDDAEWLKLFVIADSHKSYGFHLHANIRNRVVPNNATGHAVS